MFSSFVGALPARITICSGRFEGRITPRS